MATRLVGEVLAHAASGTKTRDRDPPQTALNLQRLNIIIISVEVLPISISQMRLSGNICLEQPRLVNVETMAFKKKRQRGVVEILPFQQRLATATDEFLSSSWKKHQLIYRRVIYSSIFSTAV